MAHQSLQVVVCISSSVIIVGNNTVLIVQPGNSAGKKVPLTCEMGFMRTHVMY